MTNWIVEGADPNTGEPRRIVVIAADEDEATRKGNAQGLLVSAVAPYRHASTTAPPPPQQPQWPPAHPEPVPEGDWTAAAPASARTLSYSRNFPKFGDVPRAAGRLRAADAVLSIFGWVYIVVGLAAGVLAMVLGFNTGQGLLGIVFGLVYPLAGLVGGVLLLGSGAAMRMLASIGIATAELAKMKAAER